MKKLFSSLTIATALLLSATVASADTKVAETRVADRGFKPAPQIQRQSVVDTKRALGRRGTVILSAKTFGKQGDMFVLSSDNDLDISSVKITYANGRTQSLRGSRAQAIDLPDAARIKSVAVSYVNRGARAGSIKLMAKAQHTRPQPPRGGGNGFGFGR